MQNHNNLGILEAVVPVPLCSVPVPNAFCKGVPVPLVSVLVLIGFCWVVLVSPCFSIGTALNFCTEMLILHLFGTNSLHTTSIIHNTSKSA